MRHRRLRCHDQLLVRASHPEAASITFLELFLIFEAFQNLKHARLSPYGCDNGRKKKKPLSLATLSWMAQER